MCHVDRQRLAGSTGVELDSRQRVRRKPPVRPGAKRVRPDILSASPGRERASWILEPSNALPWRGNRVEQCDGSVSSSRVAQRDIEERRPGLLGLFDLEM